MKYVIYFPSSKTYYAQDSKGALVFAASIKSAAKFSNANYAEREKEIRLNKGESSFEEAQIIPYDSSLPQTEEEVADIEAKFDNLLDTVNAFSKSIKNLKSLKVYYTMKLSEYDKMQEDILHKIEFEEMVGLRAICLMKQLKEVREKRREIKDKFTLITTLEKAGAINVAKLVDKYNNNLETRTYSPRVLKELFE
jgi:hypothetical protein